VVILPPFLLLYLADYFGPVVHTVIKVIASNSIVIYVMTDSVIMMRNTDVKEALKILWKSCGTYSRKSTHKRPANTANVDNMNADTAQ